VKYHGIERWYLCGASIVTIVDHAAPLSLDWCQLLDFLQLQRGVILVDSRVYSQISFLIGLERAKARYSLRHPVPSASSETIVSNRRSDCLQAGG
jgi:hypothetical protein